MQQNPRCELSGCFSTVLLFLLVPKSIDFLKEKTEKTDKEKEEARWNSKQNTTKEEEGMHVISSKIRNINIY